MEHFLREILEFYGIYAVFFLCMVEGDITLLLAGVLAQSGAFGNYSFAQVLFFGTSGAVIGDSFGYLMGRIFQKKICQYRFYTLAQPRIERMTEKFGAASVLISKYIYGIRVAWCMFYGVARMPYLKFLLYDTIGCFLWVLILSSVGYFFSGAVTQIIGDVQKYGIVLLIIFVIGIVGFYLLERFWLSKKVEQVDGKKLHELEQAAHNTLHDLREGINERFHLSSHNHRKEVPTPATKTEPSKIESE